MIPYLNPVSEEFLVHVAGFMLELQNDVSKPESWNTDAATEIAIKKELRSG